MAAENPSLFPPQSAGGFAAAHESLGRAVALVAPATEQQVNVLRPPLFPFACWKVDHIRFAFDSSVPEPEMRTELASLATLIQQHTRPKAPGEPALPPLLSVFGHADPTGAETYNKVLSGRRARSIYALLTRKVEIWEQLFLDQEGTGDQWGAPALQLMHAALNRTGPPPSDPHGRKALFRSYMSFLCTPAGSPAEFQVDPKDFLGRGSDPKGKADYQGCGEFNPYLLLSQLDEKSLSAKERNERYAVDRRVVVLLFRPGVKVDPQRWPCPRAQEGTSGCRKRFYSDSQARLRRDPVEERRYEKTQDTFACRFYDRITSGSPCERPPQPGKGMAFLAVRVFFHARPMVGLHVEFFSLSNRQAGSSLGPPVVTDATGLAVFPLPVPIGNYAVEVEYQKPKAICTVLDVSEPEILVLPVGRPYLCVEGDIEFEPPSGP